MESFWSIVSQPTFLVFLGGGCGSCLRYHVGEWSKSIPALSGFPWGTLIVNVVGSFLLAGLLVLCVQRPEPDYRKTMLLLGTGFCGGFTTFSTFTNETFALLREHHPKWGILYVIVSFSAGILAGVLGWWLFDSLSKR